MKLVHDHRRLLFLAIAIALLGGLAAWRLSGTAQAHRDRAARGERLTVRRERMEHRHAFRAGALRIQPGGPMLGAACFVIRGGFYGSHGRLVPLNVPRPLFRDCSEHPCVEFLAGRTRVLEFSGGGYRDGLPVLPRRPIAGCGSRVLPPGYAVPLGR